MQLMTPREAGRLTGWTPGQIDLMVYNGQATYYKQAGRIMVDVGLLYKLKMKALTQQRRVEARGQQRK